MNLLDEIEVAHRSGSAQATALVSSPWWARIKHVLEAAIEVEKALAGRGEPPFKQRRKLTDAMRE